MMVFMIETTLQHLDLYALLKVISIPLIIYIAHKFLVYTKDFLQSFTFFETCSIPKIKCNQPLLYISKVLSFYKQSTTDLPALCLAFQSLCGICQVYGKNGLFTFKLVFKPVVIFFKPETVEAVLSSPELIEKSWEYKLMRPWVGTGLITSPGSKWRKHRKLVTPAFHFSILDTFIPVFQKHANVLVSKMKSLIQEPWIDIVPLMSLSTLDVICETAMGVSMNFLSGENCDYSDAIHEIETTVMHRILCPWLYPDFIFYRTSLGKKFKSNLQLVHGLNKKVLKQKIDEISKEDYSSAFDNKSNKNSFGKKTRKPFLELLLEYHLKDPSFTEKDVRGEVATFMSAGHDTTTTAISWTLYCLGLYPEVQRQVHDELDDIFGNEKNVNISRELLAKMKYLECVIKETLRLYPVVPGIARENKEDFKVLNHTVKKGTICFVLFWELHRDPEIFPNPEKFYPERFLPENCGGRHPYAYAPFSAGPRNCVGQKFAMMETKTVLACVLKHFKVTSLDPRDKILLYPNITIRNVHPLRLRFEPR